MCALTGISHGNDSYNFVANFGGKPMKKHTKLLSVAVIAAAATLGAGTASAWWGSDYYDGPWGGPWGYGYPGYGWGGYPGYGWGGYPGYGWGGYPGYGWGGYPGYGWGGYPGYGWGGYPAYGYAPVVPAAPAAPATTQKAK
jgi:hypothetical protein